MRAFRTIRAAGTRKKHGKNIRFLTLAGLVQMQSGLVAR